MARRKKSKRADGCGLVIGGFIVIAIIVGILEFIFGFIMDNWLVLVVILILAIIFYIFINRLQNKRAKEYERQRIAVVEHYKRQLLSLSIKHYDDMTGKEFEDFCALLLSRNGYKDVKTTKGSGDYGVDIFATLENTSCAIQCKRSSKNIGNKAVQEIYSGKNYHGKVIGIIMTNQFFTKQAIDTARKHGHIYLFDRNHINELIQSAL